MFWFSHFQFAQLLRIKVLLKAPNKPDKFWPSPCHAMLHSHKTGSLSLERESMTVRDRERSRGEQQGTTCRCVEVTFKLTFN